MTPLTSPTCSYYLGGAPHCPKCSPGRTAPPTNGPGGSTAAYTTWLTQATTHTPPPPSHRPADATVPPARCQTTGTVTYSQDLPRAHTGLRLPVALALTTTTVATVMTGAAPHLLATLALAFLPVLIPLAAVIALMALGTGGLLAFTGRLARLLVGGAALATAPAGKAAARARAGRSYIITTKQGHERVASTGTLDIPLGSTMTVIGPHLGGYRRAWFIRVDHLDTRWRPQPRVLPALLILATAVLTTCWLLLTASPTTGA